MIILIMIIVWWVIGTVSYYRIILMDTTGLNEADAIVMVFGGLVIGPFLYIIIGFEELRNWLRRKLKE